MAIESGLKIKAQKNDFAIKLDLHDAIGKLIFYFAQDRLESVS